MEEADFYLDLLKLVNVRVTLLSSQPPPHSVPLTIHWSPNCNTVKAFFLQPNSCFCFDVEGNHKGELPNTIKKERRVSDPFLILPSWFPPISAASQHVCVTYLLNSFFIFSLHLSGLSENEIHCPSNWKMISRLRNGSILQRFRSALPNSRQRIATTRWTERCGCKMVRQHVHVGSWSFWWDLLSFCIENTPFCYRGLKCTTLWHGPVLVLHTTVVLWWLYGSSCMCVLF